MKMQREKCHRLAYPCKNNLVLGFPKHNTSAGPSIAPSGSRGIMGTPGAILAIALALPSLASAFSPSFLVPGVQHRAKLSIGLRATSRLAQPLLRAPARGIARLQCSSGREAVPHADFQYLNERDACGVGFIASKSGTASHEIIYQVRIVTFARRLGPTACFDKVAFEWPGVVAAPALQVLAPIKRTVPLPDLNFGERGSQSFFRRPVNLAFSQALRGVIVLLIGLEQNLLYRVCRLWRKG